MSRRHFTAHARDRGAYKKPPGTQCAACERTANYWVRIADSYMRGEDATVDTCQRHFNMAHDAFDRFCAHIRTKDKFLAKRQDAEVAGEALANTAMGEALKLEARS